MDASYFPGCSAHGTGIEYDRSARAVCETLGVRLHELAGWTCCGASSAHAVDEFLGLALPARNLALAEAAGRDVVVPCAACFHRLREAAHRIAETNAPIPADVAPFAGRVAVLHLLDFLARAPLRAALRERLARPLAGLPVVPYYGCLSVRPPAVTRAKDVERPTGLDDLLTDVGAEVREWPYRTRCCGAGMTLPRPDLVAALCRDLLDMARRARAELLVVACPLCFMNLDRQPRASGDLPVLYITELLGIALGLPARRWLRRHLVNPRPVLAARGLA